MSITAALSRDPRAPFSIESVELTEPREDEVLVRMVASGICHTDLLHRAAGGAERPVLLGHEGAGVVEAVGPAVTTVRPGDHVVLSYRSCRLCAHCRSGRAAYCARSLELNQFARHVTRIEREETPVLSGFLGQASFANVTLAHQDNAVVVPDELDLSIAAPFGCGFQTGAGAVLNVLRPDPDSSLVSYGTGPVGFAALLAARSLGVETVIAVEPSAHRRELAERLGATIILDPSITDIPSAVSGLTGRGATHALDTTGRPEIITGAVTGLSTGGILALVGVGDDEYTLHTSDLLQGKTIRGSIEGDADPLTFIPRVLQLHDSGQFPVEELITRYPFESINWAIREQASGNVVKPVLTF